MPVDALMNSHAALRLAARLGSAWFGRIGLLLEVLDSDSRVSCNKTCTREACALHWCASATAGLDYCCTHLAMISLASSRSAGATKLHLRLLVHQLFLVAGHDSSCWSGSCRPCCFTATWLIPTDAQLLAVF